MKGVYPYTWMNHHSKFKETKLPEIGDFYNDLEDKDCAKEDYKHAQKVWKELKCQTFKDYHQLYLESDVLLLADVFETYRETAIRTHKLDPSYYVTTPGYSWDCLLYLTKIKLDLLYDIDMHLFWEKGKRGGISMIGHRRYTANNPYLVKGYDPTNPDHEVVGKHYDPRKKKSYIIYVDMNNLYGGAMCEPLPYNGYKWFDEDLMEKLKEDKIDDPAEAMRIIRSLVEKQGKGYMLEVDVDYPPPLHDKHNILPMLVEGRVVIQPHDYSPKMKEIKEATRPKDGDKLLKINYSMSEKLIPTLRNRRKYVVHATNLLQALEQGLILKKVHTGVEFNEKPWMMPYINHNTDLRKKAKNKFEKDFSN